jgi:hypothetical protein
MPVTSWVNPDLTGQMKEFVEAISSLDFFFTAFDEPKDADPNKLSPAAVGKISELHQEYSVLFVAVMVGAIHFKNEPAKVLVVSQSLENAKVTYDKYLGKMLKVCATFAFRFAF